ncbi:MAG: lytic murein transglycosylase B [Steroidobacteraceae bacterium]
MRAGAFVWLACLAALGADASGKRFSGHNRFDLDREDIREFVTTTAPAIGYDPGELYAILAKAEPQPRIIELMQRPAEKVAPWWKYRENFLTRERIDKGVAFFGEHRDTLAAVSEASGVPGEYIVAIIGVETFYGRITGRWRVLDALATLGFDYSPRGEFFRAELAQFLQLVREEHVDALSVLGSYAGAMGAPQFIPSSYRNYAVDGSGDGRRDLFSDWHDVFASIANYFREHGWQAGAPVLAEAEADPDGSYTADPRNLELNETIASLRAEGVVVHSDLPAETPALLIPAEEKEGPAVRVGFANFRVITRYNRSVRYAMAVHDLATAISGRVGTQ